MENLEKKFQCIRSQLKPLEQIEKNKGNIPEIEL